MTSQRVDTRPIRTAAAAQAPVVAGGALASGGLPGLYLALAPQPYGRLDVLIVVALAAAPAVAAALVALARTVRRGEADATPWRSPRNDRGEQLLSRHADALNQLLDDRLTEHGYDLQPSPPAAPEQPGPTGTSAWPTTRPGQPSAGQPVYGGDWAGDAVREHDEQRARQARPAGRAGARLGRAVADRRDAREPGPRHDRPERAAGRRSG